MGNITSIAIGNGRIFVLRTSVSRPLWNTLLQGAVPVETAGFMPVSVSDKFAGITDINIEMALAPNDEVVLTSSDEAQDRDQNLADVGCSRQSQNLGNVKVEGAEESPASASRSFCDGKGEGGDATGAVRKPATASVDDPSLPLPPSEEKRFLRIQKGPYQPSLNEFPTSVFGSRVRRFNSCWYEEFTWLEYSPLKDSAFCLPCRAFHRVSGPVGRGHSDDAFTTNGFKNWKKGKKALQDHCATASHKINVDSLDLYLKKRRVDVMLDDQRADFLSKREKERLTNREVLRRHVEVVRMLCVSGRPFRGDQEGSDAVVRGLFLDSLHLVAKFDPLLAEHLQNGPKNAQYTSPDIQNDLIESLHNVVLQELREIVKGKSVAIMADETSDSAHREQMSVVFRIFNEDENSPEEHLFTLKRLLKTDAQSIFDSLDESLHSLGISWTDVVAVCFDGASSMSGEYNGVQAKCKEKNPNIVFVHCLAHCLNLMLTKSCGKDAKRSHNPTVVSFFGTLQLLFNLIEHSPTRHAILEKLIKDAGLKGISLKNLSLTRFAFQTLAVRAVKGERLCIILEAIEQIIDESSNAEVKVKGLGLLSQLKSFEFVACLHFMEPILEHIWKVNKILQSPQLNLLSALEDVHTLRKHLLEFKTEQKFSSLFAAAKEACDQMGIEVPVVRNGRVSSRADPNPASQHIFGSKEVELRVKAYIPLLDHMIAILDEKFNQESVDLVSAMGFLINLNPTLENLKLLSKRFEVNSSELKTEVEMLCHQSQTNPVNDRGNPQSWLKWIVDHKKKTTFSCFFRVLKEFCVIPVTSCSCERSFSKMSIVGNKLRCSMAQERLIHLLLPFVEQKICKNVLAENVIDEFKAIVPFERRMLL